LPSVQVTVLNTFLQPLALSQLSEVQVLLSLQSLAAPLTHLPAAQASGTVHALPSLQTPAWAVAVHPVDGSQPSLVQALPSSHAVALPLQTLLAQTSVDVQALPSSHEAVFATDLQPVAGSQLSVVQPFLSSQPLAWPPAH
jgi:hypothetical protein